jgi:hypothetical protein
VKGVGLQTGALAVASAAVLTVAPAGVAGSQRLDMREARSAAREAVREHPSYRVIRSAQPLRTRACWRAPRRVRCSLFRVAATPCALDGSGGVCAQVLARRVWLVDVSRRSGRAVARIVRIVERR